MSDVKVVAMTAWYDADTKRTHRFLLDTTEGVAGSIYINKESRPLPKRIVVEIKMKGDK